MGWEIQFLVDGSIYIYCTTSDSFCNEISFCSLDVFQYMAKVKKNI